MLLKIGHNPDFEIRREHYRFPVAVPFRIVYISDLHLNRHSAVKITRLIETIAQLQPDIVLLGGDYVDTAAGMPHLTELCHALATFPHVYAVAGNHDYFYGIAEIRKCFADNTIGWIEKSGTTFAFKNMQIHISGNTMLQNKTAADFHLLCLHKPVAVSRFSMVYNVAFAGHLHGSQFVFWQQAANLYPGRLFFRWNRLRATADGCLYVISKGLGDTLPLRFNCSQEVILVSVGDPNDE